MWRLLFGHVINIIIIFYYLYFLLLLLLLYFLYKNRSSGAITSHTLYKHTLQLIAFNNKKIHFFFTIVIYRILGFGKIVLLISHHL